MDLPGNIDAHCLEQLSKRVTASDTEGEKLKVIAPFTGESFGSLPISRPIDIHEAAWRARSAQQAWADLTFRKRARVFLKFHKLLFERQDEILDIIQMETGKARGHAYEEVADSAIVARYYAFNSKRHLKNRRKHGIIPLLTAARVACIPVGIVGFIVPWNYPFSLGITDVIAALMAGNGVILKPDNKTPYTALWAVDLLYQSDLPPDLVQVVIGKGPDLGPPIIDATDYLAFTGSTVTGRLIAAETGSHLKGSTMELGGKNPMLVLDGADMKKAPRVAVWDCYSSTGQLCVSIERIYIQSSIYEEFRDSFAEMTRTVSLGAAFDYSYDTGSLISTEHLEKVRSHVADALSKGANLVAGGQPRPDLGPCFYEPTVLENVTAEMDLFTEETFGPVVSLYRFESIDEAVEKANSTRYGLHATIWTGSPKLGRKIAGRLKYGTVSINDTYRATWGSIDAPMGGFKASGLGRRHGREGIVKYTEPQTVTVQRIMQVGTPGKMGEDRFHRILAFFLKLIRCIPGLR